MIIRNTTDIPDKLIAIAVAHGIQEGVTISEIVVKNKKEGIIGGNWGWYFPVDRRIVLIVPRVLEYTSQRMTYSRLPLRLTSRADFLIAVMAHELRHAWQWQVEPTGKYRKWTNLVKHQREIDAERYEYAMLELWRKQFGDLAAAAKGR